MCEPCGPTVAGGYDPENKQVHLYFNVVFYSVCNVLLCNFTDCAV